MRTDARQTRQAKSLAAGAGLTLISVPATRYGHCAFTRTEALASFAALVVRVTGRDLIASADAFPNRAAKHEFLDLAREQGAQPALVDASKWKAAARRQLGSAIGNVPLRR